MFYNVIILKILDLLLNLYKNFTIFIIFNVKIILTNTIKATKV